MVGTLKSKMAVYCSHFKLAETHFQIWTTSKQTLSRLRLVISDILGAYKNLDELNTPKFHAVSNRAHHGTSGLLKKTRP